ncbi:tripartite tricarboxylate transporter TctB family protein [Halobacillus sp. ACCC02827]|uniref:tripartite tricarboxylate transporter TctB family protein n=1 Tax=Halobacillus sp. ACCC02827 TaxID=3052090 RepID=UPI002570E431|nr:tripartite tricarboxylate transporter TctB family protein [Halobacillus sp. ACCC02827]WJE15248.1 tripartite tricarboxylate transporter TctB family protein [Halobacillus sp. ACCC02827]
MKDLRLWINATIFIIAVFLFWQTFQFNTAFQQEGVGPAFFPRVTLIVIMVLTVIETFLALRKAKEEGRQQVMSKRLFLFIVAIGAFVFLFQALPFLVISTITLFLMGVILRIKVLPSVLLSVILSVSVYYIFTEGFNIIL